MYIYIYVDHYFKPRKRGEMGRKGEKRFKNKLKRGLVHATNEKKRRKKKQGNSIRANQMKIEQLTIYQCNFSLSIAHVAKI